MSDLAGKFVGILFSSRTVTHQLHLKTTSYAKHKALNEFYDEIVDLADGFTEAYQGCYEELLDIPTLATKTGDDPLKYISDTAKWIEENRYDVCPKNNTVLQNEIDSILKLFYSTKYKLKFLS